MARSRGSDGCLKVSVRYPSLIGGLVLASFYFMLWRILIVLTLACNLLYVFLEANDDKGKMGY